MTTYGILIFEGVEELDFVGPWEVFATAACRCASCWRARPQPPARPPTPSPARAPPQRDI
jgi:putative intracellular protease/amidase